MCPINLIGSGPLACELVRGEFQNIPYPLAAGFLRFPEPIPVLMRCPISALIPTRLAARCGPYSGVESGSDPELAVWRFRQSEGCGCGGPGGGFWGVLPAQETRGQTGRYTGFFNAIAESHRDVTRLLALGNCESRS